MSCNLQMKSSSQAMALRTFLFFSIFTTTILLSAPLIPAVDFNYPAIFNFGDSNSDTGGLVSAGIGEPLDLPNGATYFHKPSGRFCDGRLIIDFLSDAMDLPFLNAYLESVGVPNFRRGCNFASAGCTILPATASSVSPFSFGIQVAQFSRFKARVLELLAQLRKTGWTEMEIAKANRRNLEWLFPWISSFHFNHLVNWDPHSGNRSIGSRYPLDDQANMGPNYLANYYWPGGKLDRFLPPEDYFKRGLYMFDIGQNDLAGAFYSKSDDQVIASIPTILQEFEEGVKKIYGQGAKNFWIHNTGPLGCLPQNIAAFGKDPSKLDELGCVNTHNRAAKLFNLQLHALCRKLQGEFSDANITYVDVFSIKFNLISNYSRYGFEHPITACCGFGGPPLNYDSRISCGQTKFLNGTSVTTKSCDDTTEYVSWDGIHYTEAANLYVSSQILTGKYSDPPFFDKMPFLFKLKF